MKIYIKKGDKVKISKIEFDGVSEMKLSTLKRKLKGTKEKKFWRIFTPSKYVPKKFEEDKGKLI